MKKLLTILGAVAVAAFAVPHASAQTHNAASLTISGTVPASDTLTLSSTVGIIDVRRWKTIAIQPTFALGAAGTANVVFNFAKSADGVRYETVPSVSGTIAGTGTGTTSAVLNVDTGGCATLKLITIVNSNTSSIVNPVILYGRKPGH